MEAGRVDPAAGPETWLGDGTETSERYASMFIHHPHAAFSVDRRGHYTAANSRALAMTGLSMAQMRETHFSQVIHPDDVHLLEEGFERALLGLPQLIEARVLRNDGEIIDIRCTAIPVVVGGEVIGVHGISEDITEAKRVVRELEEANLAKTLFLATVGHELRTPLASLVGATDLLLESALDPEQSHCLELVHRSGQRLVHLVEDLLEFSGLQAHRTVLQPGPFDVRTVITGVREWAAPFAESRGLAISLSVDQTVPATAMGDVRRVTQVVTNLVQNAIASTPSGAIDVRVRCTDAWIEVAVSDTGVGIAEDGIDALFQPFAHADRFAAREQRGVGLGLAICRALADLMGGRLEATSTLGEGSTFTFGFPQGRVVDPPAAALSPAR